jgi:hypothetical protein
LQLLGKGGAKTVLRGWQLAREIKANTKANGGKLSGPLLERVLALEQRGATEHFIYEAEQRYASWGLPGRLLADFAKRGNRDLEIYDTAQRLALEEALIARGHPADMIGDEIRNTLGDYTDQAPLIKELRDRWGANFPAWGLGVVPRAMTKAVRENPRGFGNYARANRRRTTANC